MEKMILFIKRDYEFMLAQDGYDATKGYTDDKLFDKYYFADIQTQNEKIKFIQDQSVKDEQLLLVEDDPIMQEVCEFDILIINEAYKEISQNKTMSIYEALKFVKHTMEHIKAF